MSARAGEVAVKGPTFAIRATLRELGGRWDSEDQCWYVPEEQQTAAEHALRTRPAEWRSPNRWSSESE